MLQFLDNNAARQTTNLQNKIQSLSIPEQVFYRMILKKMFDAQKKTDLDFIVFKTDAISYEIYATGYTSKDKYVEKEFVEHKMTASDINLFDIWLKLDRTYEGDILTFLLPEDY